ncbi:MAG TPA: TRAP transporter large permease subunit [Thermoanaerobaculia bacterium]|nr:TRAP transporter large permease subunit [Thermoanaerobaculia bacterium]
MATALLAAMLLPLIDVVGRPLGGFHVPGGAPYLQQLTLWIAFLGGLLATREGAHLTLSTAELLGEGHARRAAAHFAASVAAAVAAVLAYGAWQVVLADREEGKILPGGIPQWASECVMPAALALISLRLAWRAAESWWGRLIAVAVAGGVFALGTLGDHASSLAWPLALLVIAAALLGAPVFAAMGGVALVLFFKDGVPVSAVPAEIYRLIASPTLPAIPLLTACGYVLAESRASSRLVRFFRALFGWMPGGVAVMVAAVCAMFTTFTGGSGVTIIALGGLVYPMLREEGYSEGFSLGLVTAAGSLGLLFPPSLPVILYSVVAGSREMNAPADQLYLAGLLPGLLLVVLVALYGVWIGVRTRAPRQRFAWRELGRSAWEAKWELLLPVVVVALFLSGLTSLVETAAAALLYAILVEWLLTRDLHPRRGLPQALVKSTVLTGAVLILLASALGLTSYLVDAQIPDLLLSWVQTHVSSRLVFLLALNLILLVLGSVLEIYSAIIVLAPLVVPLGVAFGVDPIHLGIIFLANLELGFLFPPVGLNLFLSSSRFGKRLPELYRHVVPFLIILGAGVLLITYLPGMSLGLVRLLGR